ncbi:MAG: glycosyltransferase family 2 protein [Saprospiraceae bacterium]|nr:glycosyltransferase family 2 protein [Lewinella sp.]
MYETPPIPIIILNWNGLADTEECITSLEEQSYQNFVIHLVDNGSNAAEVNAIKELYLHHPRTRLHLNPENLGFTLGNNRILKTILKQSPLSPYVVLLNNDTSVTPNWLEQLIATAIDQKVDMVASRMINYYERSKMDNAGHQMLNTLEILPIGNEEPITDFDQHLENIGPCAGAALYSTSMLQQIGLFDERFRNGYEDVELGLRGIVCGYRAVYAPDAIVFHKISRSVNKIRDFDYTLNIQKHIYYIIAKLIPAYTLLSCLPFLLFRTFAALLINLLFLRWKFLRVQIQALRWVFGSGRKVLISAHQKFFQENDTISSMQLLKKMDFFLKRDIKRFYKYIVRREKMVFEKYTH